MAALLSLMFTLVYGLSLVQEAKDIECKNTEVSVLIDKRDRFIEVTDISDLTIEKYSSYEFLDSAILLQKKDSDEFAIIQLTPKNKAELIVGHKQSFTESNCKDTGGSKTCNVNSKSLFWSSTKLSYDQSYKSSSLLNMDIRHYGVYPNDGTYFLATSANQMGLMVIDYGSKLDLLYGKSSHLDCSYIK